MDEVLADGVPDDDALADEAGAEDDVALGAEVAGDPVEERAADAEAAPADGELDEAT